MRYTVTLPETETTVAVIESEFSDASVRLENGMVEVVSLKTGERGVFPIATGSADGSVTIATALGNVRLLATRGAAAEGAMGARSLHKSIKSSMPGKVLKLFCKVGDKIEAGAPLLIIEAMKMENEIRAMQSGVVEQISVQPGQKIETGELLVKLQTGE